MESDVVISVPDRRQVAAEASAGPEAFEDILADVAHALRNHFHRLYYWMDVVAEQDLAPEGRSAVDAAVAALRSIESLTAGTMALSQHVDLDRISMDVSEVAQCAGSSLERQGATVRVECGAVAGVRVAIDASHVSRTIEIVGARLGVAPDRSTSIDLRAEVDDDGWAVVAMHACGTSGGRDGNLEQMLEWAQAERTMQQHGGRLLWEEAGAEEHRAVILLPVAE